MHRPTLVRCTGTAAICAILVVSTTGWLQGQEQEPGRTGVIATDESISVNAGSLSPVDRLKARSSQQRWQQLSRTVRPASGSRTSDSFKASSTRSRDSQWQRTPHRSAINLIESIEPRYADETAQELFSNDTPQTHRSPARFSDFEPESEAREFGAQQPSQIVAAQAEEEDIYLEIEKEFPRLPVGGEFREERQQNLTNDPVEYNDYAVEVDESSYPENSIPLTPETEYAPRQQEPARLAQREILGTEDETRTVYPLIQSPKDLKPLSEIQPFYDYEPDPKVRARDPYLNVYPRPADAPPLDQDIIYPEVVGLGDDVYQERELAHVDYPWLAADVYHYPLYFEDPDFERYGHTHHECVQPFASLGLFGVQLIGLPYQMAIDPICEKEYTLGWYRPGECAPYTYYQIPWNTRAAVTSGLFYTGMFYAFP